MSEKDEDYYKRLLLGFDSPASKRLSELMTPSYIDEVLKQQAGVDWLTSCASAPKEKMIRELMAPGETAVWERIQKENDRIWQLTSVMSGMNEPSALALCELEVATKVSELFRFDSLAQSLLESYRLVDLYAHFVEPQIPGFEKAILAFGEAEAIYGKWRLLESDEPLPTLDAGPWVAPSRERLLSADLVVKLRELPKEPALAEETESAIEEIEADLLLSLPAAIEIVNPALFRLWKGAWDALRSENPDKVRHAITSARELVTQVLHSLAPDRSVRSWSREDCHYVNNKPTRRARLLFIVHRVHNGPLEAYLNKEIDAWLALMDVFQNGTHSIDPGLSVAHLRTILRKVHSMICTLVEMHRLQGP